MSTNDTLVCDECGSDNIGSQGVPESDVIVTWCKDCGFEDAR